MSHLNRRLFLKSLAMAPVMLYCGEAKAGPALRFLQRGLSGVSGLTCVTEYFKNDAAYNTRHWVGQSADNVFVGQAGFVPDADFSLCKITINLYCHVGSITGFEYEFRIYTMDGVSLDTLLGTSNTVYGDNAWSNTPVTFDFAIPVAMVTTGDYGLVVHRSDGSATWNHASVSFSAAGNLSGVYQRWDSLGGIIGTTTVDLICTGYR